MLHKSTFLLFIRQAISCKHTVQGCGEGSDPVSKYFFGTKKTERS
jgi:hypothetical protein